MLSGRLTSEELNKRPSLYKIFYLLVPIVIYYLVTDITEVILWSVVNVIFSGASEEMLMEVSKYSGTIQGLIYGVGIVISVLILKTMVINEVTFVPENEEKPRLVWWQILVLIATAAVVSIALNWGIQATGMVDASESFKSVYDSQYSVNFISGLVLYGLLSPTMEEIMFRGILYNRMKRMFPIPLSIVVLSVLFGVFHGNLVQGVYGTLMGLMIVLFYEKWKSFAAPVIVHSVANLTIYILSYTLWK